MFAFCTRRGLTVRMLEALLRFPRFAGSNKVNGTRGAFWRRVLRLPRVTSRKTTAMLPTLESVAFKSNSLISGMRKRKRAIEDNAGGRSLSYSRRRLYCLSLSLKRVSKDRPQILCQKLLKTSRWNTFSAQNTRTWRRASDSTVRSKTN